MSTAYEFDMENVGTPEEVTAGNYEPPAEGTYHLAISEVNMQPVSKKGEAKNGMELTFEVQDGTVAGQEKKSFRECFYWPSPSNKDGGKFLQKRLVRLGMTTGVITADMLGTKAAVPWEDMAARHFVAAVHHESFTGDNGKEVVSAKIDGLKMWHVASPEVAAIPKDGEVLELMPMGDDPFTTGHSSGQGGDGDDGSGGGGGSGGGNGGGNGSSPPKPAPKAAPAKAKAPAAKTAARATKPAAQQATAPQPAAAGNDPYGDL